LRSASCSRIRSERACLQSLINALAQSWFESVVQGEIATGERLLDENKGKLDIDMVDGAGVTALGYACAHGHSTFVEMLLRRGANINKIGNDPVSRPLRIASLHGQVDVVRVLLDAGVDINEAGKTTGNTALHVAACEGHKGVIRLLLVRKADFTVHNNDGKTALDVAKANKKMLVVPVLEAAAKQGPHFAPVISL
jgi:ankyrin repeat protein